MKIKYILIPVLLILAFLGGYLFYQYTLEKKFIENTRVVASEMVGVSALTESVNEFYVNIWRNAVFKEKSYWAGGKYQQKEFNEALAIAKEDMKPSIDTIHARSFRIDAKIKDLSNPPGKYSVLHASILKLYSLYNEYTGMARSPQGSLLTFGTRNRELSTETLKVSKEIDVLLPAGEPNLK